MKEIKEIPVGVSVTPISQPTPFTQVVALGERGPGGAFHHYAVLEIKEGPEPNSRILAEIDFQEGPFKQVGANGCLEPDLLTMILDRLTAFQAGEFSCRENALVATKVQEALMWSEERRKDRVKRGVYSTMEK